MFNSHMGTIGTRKIHLKTVLIGLPLFPPTLASFSLNGFLSSHQTKIFCFSFAFPSAQLSTTLCVKIFLSLMSAFVCIGSVKGSVGIDQIHFIISIRQDFY